MEYLFFDIECADGNRAICEYGYVLTDENFNVIKNVNLLMDPECRFNLTGREGQKDLILSYPYKEYRNYYPFPDSYPIIKKLMTRDDILIFGHAVNNDIAFIIKDCNRYNLELFDYVAYDIQKMLPAFSKKNRRYTSLEKAFADLVPESVREKLIDHRACDDAMKTMLVFKAMVEELGFTPKDLIESCPNSVFKALEYWKKAKVAKKERYRKVAQAANRKVGQNLWNDFCQKYEASLSDPKSIGRLVTVSSSIKENNNNLKRIMKIVEENGYIPLKSISGSDYLVVVDEEDKNKMVGFFKYPYSGQIMPYQSFMDFIGHEQ